MCLKQMPLFFYQLRINQINCLERWFICHSNYSIYSSDALIYEQDKSILSHFVSQYMSQQKKRRH